MLAKGWTDAKLDDLFKKCFLEKIPPREGGWDSVNDFFDVFSGGEKQRCGMARLLYHHPKFAILDECTSATSIESEGPIYELVKSSGITILTVSHRPNLWRYHERMLRFDDNQGWELLGMDEVLKNPHQVEALRRAEE